MKFICLLAFIGAVSSVKIPTSYDPVKLKDDADAKLTVPEIIAKYGYPVEVHQIETPDGYLLTLHRIPYGKSGPTDKKRVMLLQHGLLSSSADWVITGPERALGYIMADQGYDVWLGNARGNRYSRNHTTLNPDSDSQFWQFSWHEIGIYDLPTMIDYILEQTGESGVYYAGHSQGTTSFYVMASMLPEYNEKIKVHVSMAPIAYESHMYSPLMHIMAFWEGPMETLLPLIGYNEYLPSNEFLALLGETVCHEDTYTQILCQNSMFAVCGFSYAEMDESLLQVVMGHTPAGASTKQVLHYGQEMNSGHFRQYDFGMVENLNKYGSIFPPDYDLNKITAPVYLIYSHNDWLAGEIDVLRLADELNNCQGKFLVAEDTFNHLDFMYGINARKYAYNYVISLFARY